ncbi:MAG: RNA polymerase sigma factor RpoE [Endozoicomonadaceae bacterium]|nr:RNA polymerase sigma factor RpoE [Endozoicomonadaceae bacterium]
MTKAPDTDNQLINRVKEGEKQAFDLLVIRYQYKILALVSNYIKNRNEVQDVAQETFIKAYRALNNFRGDSAFYTWLYRIAINTAKNHVISQQRKSLGVDIDIDETEHFDEDNLYEISTPEDILYKEEVKETIFNVINSLPDGLRTAITLREIDGLSYEEISDVMDCPVGTVRSRIFRARTAIDKALAALV